jgi:hypothetical protein
MSYSAGKSFGIFPPNFQMGERHVSSIIAKALNLVV